MSTGEVAVEVKAPWEGTGWRPEPSPDGKKLVLSRYWPTGRMTLAVVEEEVRGGKLWRHMSVSSSRARGRVELPTWLELMAAKRDILGRGAKAIMVLAPDEDWFSVAEVFHLYQALEEGGDGIPDMRTAEGAL